MFANIGKEKIIIGMVHLGPLPGTPFHQDGSYDQIVARAVADATALYEGGASGCLVQTIDRVYPTGDTADSARVAAVANIVHEIGRATGPGFHIGVQILRNALQASLAVAKVSGGAFLRCAALVGRTMTSDGIVAADPLAVNQYRQRINAQDISLIAEIHSMHFKSIDGLSIADLAQAAVRAGADAVSLGEPDEEHTAQMVRSVRAAVPDTPIFLPGYTNHDNAARRLAIVDGAFVGTCLEEGGWGSAVDVDRVRAYMDIVKSLE